MKELNSAVWYLAFIIPLVPACIIAYHFFGFLLTIFPFCIIVDLAPLFHIDIGTLQVVPVVIGCLGFLIICFTPLGQSIDMKQKVPELGTYPVPFIGLSKMWEGLVSEYYTIGKWTFFLGNPMLYFISPFALPVFVVTVAAAVMLLPYLVFVDVVYYAAMAAAKVVDEMQYRHNTKRFVCPECGRASDRPVYDVCGNRIPGLRPSESGIFTVEMEAASFPCFGSNGKRKELVQSCPLCSSSVETKEGRPFVVSVAGAPSSGKTSFVYSVIGRLESTSGSGKADAALLYHAWEGPELARYRAGSCGRTPASFQKPHVVVLESGRLTTRRLLYMFDTGGEFFTGRIEADIQPQYSHTDALALVLDPSCDRPADVALGAYRVLVERYRQFNRMDASVRIDVPLAVVVTHSDIPGPLSGLSGTDLRDRMADIGYFGLVNSAEKDFRRVSFFTCDARAECKETGEVVKRLCEDAGEDIGQFFD
ncbi:MAG: hypothetical protein IKQ60_10795 [Candidatus Methanomethylophilaceae archaeon]|nr:hypothetical protein [Candidatus Methanomethylophilaceae archaeon]